MHKLHSHMTEKFISSKSSFRADCKFVQLTTSAQACTHAHMHTPTHCSSPCQKTDKVLHEVAILTLDYRPDCAIGHQKTRPVPIQST